MKKTIIAGAAASAVLAAMPVVGVFAEISQDLKVTDTVQLTLTDNCQFSTDSAENKKTVTLSGTNTTHGEFTGGTDGSVMRVSCNTKEGWTLSANVSDMTRQGGTEKIEFGSYVSSGNKSVWSAKIDLQPTNDKEHVTISSGWDKFETATATAGAETPIAGAKGDDNAKEGVGALVITPSYKAFVAEGQTAGTYEGTVVYTLHSVKTN